MSIKSYRDLLCWQKAMGLVTEVYRITGKFPKEEQYGLTSQVRRCAISIPSNTAEGFGRHSTNDYIRFLQIASGSLYELQTQIEIACNLGYIEKSDFSPIAESINEIERMLNSLISKLQDHAK